MQGQDILVNDFNTGAFSMFIVDGMEDKDVAALKAKIEDVDHVERVLWYDSVADIRVPRSMLPDKLYDVFNSDTGTMMAIFFAEGTSADGTMDAIAEIRSLAGKQCFLSGMSAVVTDTKNLAEKETPVYVLIAVILAVIVLAVTMNSFFVPLLFMLSIGIAIIYNLGSNYFLGEISYITKALTAVLQLGVTLDYSIFLMHSYEEQQIRYEGDKHRAMAHAISQTFSSILGSSITTIAGFIALCFMTFTLVSEADIFIIDLQPFREIQGLLSRYASSINQIAKRVNSTGLIYSDNIKCIKNQIVHLSKEVWQIHSLLLDRTNTK